VAISVVTLGAPVNEEPHVGVAAFGVATVVFGLTHTFWVAMTALVVLGVGDMVSVFVRSLLVQLNTPDEIRGRVSALLVTVLWARVLFPSLWRMRTFEQLTQGRATDVRLGQWNNATMQGMTMTMNRNMGMRTRVVTRMESRPRVSIPEWLSRWR
jgi:hypothetical protein